MRPSRLVLTAAALLVAACNRSPVDGAPQARTSDGRGGRIEIAEAFAATLWKLDPYTISSAAIEGDQLRLVVEYGGGCATHHFRLVASDAWMESEPVQVAVVLTHDAQGDVCRAAFIDTMRYDLTPLKAAYWEAYRRESGTVILRLWRYAQPLRYTF